MPSDSELGNRIYTNKDGSDGCVWGKTVGNGASATPGAAAQYQVIVDAQGNAHMEMHGNNPGGNDVVQRMAENGSIIVDGVYDVSNNSDPSNTGLVGMVRNGTPADSQQTLRITGKANVAGDVRALDISLFDENAVPYSRTNPLPVSIEESEGTEVHDPDIIEDLAKDATDNHEYTIAAGKTFELNKVLADASGDARYHVEIESATVPGTYAFLFRSYSTAAKRGDIEFKPPVPIVAGATSRKIRVIRKNMDNDTQDVITTICGVEF